MTRCHFRAKHPLYGLQQDDTYRRFAMRDVKKRTVQKPLCESYGPPPAPAEREASLAREACHA